MEFSASAIPITPEQVLAAAGVTPHGNAGDEAQDVDELFEGSLENQRVMQLNMTKRLVCQVVHYNTFLTLVV